MDGVIAFIFDSQKHVLAIQRKDVPAWVFPGGGIDPGETPECAVVREVLEETGFQVEICRQVATYHPTNRIGSTTHTFECHIIGGEATLGEETAAIGFFPIDQLPHYFFPLARDWLQDALLQRDEVLKAPLKGLTYRRVFMESIRHPRIVLHYAVLYLIRKFFTFNPR
ncbi:MAG: pyrophosphohydrolase [Chlamydiales bacterium]|jgi:8-oxo-dGTP pyrophosphatase MutT (NUDIX family)|nr:pyrophosphohydrolase [Chlamydiales bacterium]